MTFDDIKVHSIVRIKLSGDRIYVINKGIDGSEAWVSARRCQHTTDHGDVYITESWSPDELQSEEDHAAEHAKERSDLLDILRAKGVMVLNDLSDMQVEKDPNAN